MHIKRLVSFLPAAAPYAVLPRSSRMKRLARFGWLLSCLIPAQGLAQSAFDGKWKIDNNQTESTVHYDYVLQDGTFHCTTCDPPIIVEADGQDHRVAGDPCVDTVSVRVVDERTTEETDKKNGRTVGTLRMKVSDDGTTAAEDWTESCNAKGDILSGTDTLVRVAPGPSGSHAISGSWKISKRVSRSENTLVITLKLTTNTFSFSDPTDQSYVAKLDGSETPFKGDLEGTVVSVKRFNESTIEQTDKRAGKVVEVTRFVISADGKTLTIFEEDKTKGTVRRFVGHKQ